MKHLLLSVLLLLAPMVNAEEKTEQAEQLLRMLSIANKMGSCEMTGRMFAYQKNFKIAGGNNFIVKFLTIESIWQEVTLDEYTDYCVKISEQYHEYLNISNALKNK